jgi:rare lipoprotein A
MNFMRIFFALALTTMNVATAEPPTKNPPKCPAGQLTTSFYCLEGKLMANGRKMRCLEPTAASNLLPLGMWLRLTHSTPKMDYVVVVRITDRGPFITGRTLDVSQGAARLLHMETQGVACLEAEVLQPGPQGANP